MLTLQVLCEAAEMSTKVPINESERKDGSLITPTSSETSVHVETATSLVSLSGAKIGDVPVTSQKFQQPDIRVSNPDDTSSNNFHIESHNIGRTSFSGEWSCAVAPVNQGHVTAASQKMVVPSFSPQEMNSVYHAVSKVNSMSPVCIDTIENIKAEAIISRTASKLSRKVNRKGGWVKKQWDERLEELKVYKSIHGDCNVPTLSKDYPSLGHWVHDQRKQYRLWKNGKRSSMNMIRIEQLTELDFKWSLQRHATMKTWSERFEELKVYKANKKNTNVPIRWKENPTLGQWVSTQRQEYGNLKLGKKSTITKDRIDALESIGFVWSLRDTAKMAPRKSWAFHFEALKKFYEKNGHCDLQIRSNGSLGRWVEKQRFQYKLLMVSKPSKLSRDQVNALESIGFKWKARENVEINIPFNKEEKTNINEDPESLVCGVSNSFMSCKSSDTIHKSEARRCKI